MYTVAVMLSGLGLGLIMLTVTVLVYLPRGAAQLDVLVLFASRCYTTPLRGDSDISISILPALQQNAIQCYYVVMWIYYLNTN